MTNLYLATFQAMKDRFVAGISAPDPYAAKAALSARLEDHRVDATIEQVLDQTTWRSARNDNTWPNLFEPLHISKNMVSFAASVLRFPPRNHGLSDNEDSKALHTETLGSIEAQPNGEIPSCLKRAFAASCGPTLALLDASAIPGLPEFVQGTGTIHRCLFRGQAQEEMQDAAPRMVEIEPDSQLSRFLFQPKDYDPLRLKHANAICLLPNGPNIDVVEKRFRRLIRVQRQRDNQWLLFRFWDARTLEDLRPVLSEDDAWSLFGAEGLLAIGQDARWYRLADGVGSGDNHHQKPFKLTDIYLRAMAKRQRVVFRETMVDTLCYQLGLIERQAVDIVDRALDFCGDVGLYSRDSVMGYALLTGHLGTDIVLRERRFAGLGDPRISEAGRKTLIHKVLEDM